MTWEGPPRPARPALGARDRARIARRGGAMAAVLLVGLAALLAVRLVERPLCGMRRPVSPWVTQGVCVAALRLMGLRRVVRGAALRGRGAIVANHVSWLDILALNASSRVAFVSKSEVASWPGIGWLARATGTLFIRRVAREAPAQAALMADRLASGHRLLFFPEGTSTDGLRVLPFKPTLFAAFRAAGVEGLRVQPVTLRYLAPAGAPSDFYGWWGDRGFGESLVEILAARRQGRVEVLRHAPLDVAAFPDRKALARAAEAAVRAGLEGGA